MESQALHALVDAEARAGVSAVVLAEVEGAARDEVVAVVEDEVRSLPQ